MADDPLRQSLADELRDANTAVRIAEHLLEVANEPRVPGERQAAAAELDQARSRLETVTRAIADADATPVKEPFTQGAKATCLKALGYSVGNPPSVFFRERKCGAIDFDVSLDGHYRVWILDESKLSRPLPKPKAGAGV